MHFSIHFRFNSTSFPIMCYLCFCHAFQCFYFAIPLSNALHVCTYSLLSVRYALQCFYLVTGSWTFDSIAAATRASTYTDILYILPSSLFLLSTPSYSSFFFFNLLFLLHSLHYHKVHCFTLFFLSLFLEHFFAAKYRW